MKTVFLATALGVGMVVSAEASVTQIDQNPFSIEPTSLFRSDFASEPFAGQNFWPTAAEIGAPSSQSSQADFTGNDHGWDWDNDWDWGNLPPWWWWDHPEFPDLPGRPPEITPPPAPVPLPPALLMLTAALAGLGVMARRKKS